MLEPPNTLLSGPGEGFAKIDANAELDTDVTPRAGPFPNGEHRSVETLERIVNANQHFPSR